MSAQESCTATQLNVNTATATMPGSVSHNNNHNNNHNNSHNASLEATASAAAPSVSTASAATPATLLEKLYQGQALDFSESRQLFSAVVQGEFTDSQLAAVVISMKIRGEQPAEIAGAARAMLDHAGDFPRPNYPFTDIVGTGGDGSNSINISTASAFVAAACGIKVAKHGNRSVSSRSGSSDLLTALGVAIDMDAARSRQALDQYGLCFLFAPQYHQGFRHAMPVRQQLKTRTLFNVLGPLINPARPPLALIGVYSPQLVLPIARTLHLLGYQRAAVVHSGGMDEVSLHAPTQVAELDQGDIRCYQLEAADFGLAAYPQQALLGGSPQQNAHIIRQLLQGKGSQPQQFAIAANVAMLMRLHGNDDLRQNAQIALQTLQSGAGWQTLLALKACGETQAQAASLA